MLPRTQKEIHIVPVTRDGEDHAAIVLAERLGNTFAVKAAIVLLVLPVAGTTGERLASVAEACRDHTGARKVVWNHEAEGMKELRHGNV